MLGTALITSDNGNMVGRVRYYPYGGIRAQEGTIPTDKLFTSQQRETTNGIYHYGARLYNADIGRMPQADTIVPEPMNPVAYNRYSYVYNNPVNYVDPTGCATAIPPYSTTTKEKTCSKVYSRNNNAGFLAIRLSLVIEFRYNGSKILST